MSYQIYKLIHFLGIFGLLTSIAGMCFVAATGNLAKHPWKRFAAIAHGSSLFLVLFGGFGMMVRIGVTGGGWPAWVWVKLIIWLGLGVVIVAVKRRPSTSSYVLLGTVLLSFVAGYVALYKPF